MAAPLRLGRVDFINTFPLKWALDRHLPEGLAEEVAAVPTALNRMLAEGAIDVGNVSSIEYARHADEWVLLPSLCIGSAGAVESVHLGDGGAAPRGALRGGDREERVERRARRRALPAHRAAPGGRGGRRAAPDRRRGAALRARRPDAAPRPRPALPRAHRAADGVRGLGGAPRRPAPRRPRPRAERRRRRGLRAPAAVARAAADRFGFPAGYIARYFEKLRYRFGVREQEGLLRFYELAREAGAIDAVPPLRFTSSTLAHTPTHAETL